VLNRLKILFVAGIWVVAFALLAANHWWPGRFAVNAVAATDGGAGGQKTTGPPAAPPPTREEKLVTGEEYAKKLLLLMDLDKSGKVSKQEFMDFMSAEFDRMDTNHDGQLDVKELTGLRVKSYVGK
jgi:hypothetical protein